MKIELFSLQDIVFVCCIFLILTLSYTHETTIDIDTPDYNQYAWCCDGCTSLLIDIDKHNGVWIKDRFVDVTELPVLMSAAKHNGSANVGVMIRAEKSSKVSTYVQIVDVAKTAGFKNIDLLAH